MSTATEYRRLLLKYVPEPIRSEKDYRRALLQLEKLMVPHPDAAHSLLIEVFATLIENYESREYPTPQISPPEVLAHLLKSMDIKPAELAKATGIPAATLSNVLANRRGISKENAIKLSRYFGLSPVLFLAATESARQVKKQARTSSRQFTNLASCFQGLRDVRSTDG